ncbi:IPT/TIG domain protein (macronuclear) [Tetrahymena thermophila SB210]|uniref:IPT/TIG domain protein n=1 Tax=Tetrahymena thermophila (strain SB210) TaxID=312017 RepID=Q22Y24_TETTS|nr:IPT/TIG domain protein [Tetrahymena thermophila SB210]EAR90200.2 IPT/TIG domain protein [Tetrahymena thermophila SB210]|eukprot:XP_001010445.2 IPT/TIG domain protein [Tetrahymena thermophila SB210]
MALQRNYLILISLILLINAQAQFLHRKVRQLQTSEVTASPQEVSFIGQSHITFSGISSTSDIQKVELSNNQQTIELQILQIYPNSVLCQFQGGFNGVFQGIITLKNGQTIQAANQITSTVRVNSISPSQGNSNGGVLLTVYGFGFSYDTTQMQVLIGSVGCDILTSTDTQIQCVTRSAQNLVNQSGIVVVTSNNLLSQSADLTQTTYTFVNIQQQPSVTAIQSQDGNFYRGYTYSIIGSNLLADKISTLLFIGNRNIQYQQTSTGLQFVVPQDLSSTSNSLIVFVGSNGSSAPYQFQVKVELDKLYCQDPSGNLMIRQYGNLFFAASIKGLAPSSQIQIQYDQGNNRMIEFEQNNNGIAVYTSLDYNQMPSQVTQLIVDGQNILNQPIKINVNPNSNYLNVDFDISSDSSTFTLTLKPNQQFPDLQIYNILILDSNWQIIDNMKQISGNTFSFNKYSQKNRIYFHICSDAGEASFYPSSSDQFYLPQPTVTMLPYNQNVQTGDILKFQITPSNQNVLYSMNVLCHNGNMNNSTDTNLDDYSVSGKDVYQILPSTQDGDIFGYQFPTILQRNLATSHTCDIIIAVTNPLNVKKSQQADQINQESNTFVSQFLQQQDGHQINGGNYYPFNDIGSNQIFNSYFIELFLKAVTPVKQSSYVLSVEPQNLSAYGGETVIITGNNFQTSQNTGIQTTKVSFLGVDCQVISLTNTQIKCISGQSQYYDPSHIQQTKIILGQEFAFMFTHVNYVFNYSDKVQMRYVQNDLINGNQFQSIPLGLGLNLDLGKIFQSDQLNFDTINVDGYLSFQTSKDLSITINLLSGKGIFSLGSQDIRINSNFDVQINKLNILKVRSYGQKLQKYNYSLLSQVSPLSTSIILNENPVYLQKGAQIVVLATTQNDVNEVFQVDSVSGNSVLLTTPVQNLHTNIQETLTQKNGQKQNLSINVPVLQTSRNVQISIGESEPRIGILDDIQDTRVNIPYLVIINNLVNSFVNVSAPSSQSSNQYVEFKNIQSSVIQAYDDLVFNGDTFQNSYIIRPNNSNTLKTISINFKLFEGNFLQAGVSITRYFYYTTPAVPSSQNFSNNIIVSSNSCLDTMIESTQIISMEQNVCFSTNYFSTQLSPHNIRTQSLAFTVLNLSQSVFQNQNNAFRNPAGYKLILESDNQKQTKFFIVANSISNATKFTPNIITMQYRDEGFVQSQLQQFELQGFSNTPQDSLVGFQSYVNGINLIESFNVVSDISQNSSFFQQNNQSQGFILIDSDGSLTGQTQNVFSANLVRPQLSCTQNAQHYFCSKQIGIITAKASNWNKYPQDYNCYQLSGEQTLVSGQMFNNQGTFVAVLEDITEFQFVEQQDNSKPMLPCYFELNPLYFQDTSKGYIVKYKQDVSNLKVKLQLEMGYNGIDILPVNNLNVETCQHGDYQIVSDGILVCIKNKDGQMFNISVSLQTQ